MPTAAQRHHLHQIEPDQRAGRTETFEGGDDDTLAVEIGLDRIGDTDAADDKRGEADKRRKSATRSTKRRTPGALSLRS